MACIEYTLRVNKRFKVRMPVNDDHDFDDVLEKALSILRIHEDDIEFMASTTIERSEQCQ